MLLGVEIRPSMLIAGGSFLFVLLVFQMLVGLRVIRFKGGMHYKIHRAAAFVMLAGAVFHALAGLAFLGVIG